MNYKNETVYKTPETMVLSADILDLICTSPSASTEEFNELTEIEW